MRSEKVDRTLLEQFLGKDQDFRLRVIVKMIGETDSDKVRMLRDLGADGAIDETVYISTRLTKAAVETLSDQDWVVAIEVPADPTYNPGDPPWLVR
ncbi:MAG: hypothetical protein HY225_02050 [Candidatus Vogelbacteria bacterium]|nr:hypothetical protein [Candidatus Vogelbacteria bacterium]